LYRVRDLLQEEGETPFRKCSKEEERRAMGDKLEAALAWLHDHDDATTNEYIEQRSSLE
jgi:hypoxia up-regulated 1